MAVHAHSTPAPARPLLPLAAGRTAPRRDAFGRFTGSAPARPEMPPEPLLSAVDEGESTTPPEQPSPAADEVLDDIARELDRQGVPRGRATTPSLAAPDPAFAAVRAFDRVVAEWDAAFSEYLGIMDALDPDGRRCWDDPQGVARAVLGPVVGSTVAALDGLSRRMGALDARHEAAEARLLSTRAASEVGAAALRACVRRYARRPFGWRADEAIMLGSLAA